MLAALNTHIRKGRGVLLTGISGFDLTGTWLKYEGMPEYEIDYASAGTELAKDIVKSPFLFYEGAYRTRLLDGEVLCEIREPYFNRTYAKYCSHQNTPYKTEVSNHPAAVRKGNIVYLAHPVCRMYQKHGAQYHRDYFINALKLVYRDPVLEVDMPSAGRVSLYKYPDKKQYVLHLLYASPIQRGRVLVIEDIPEIRDISVTIDTREQIKEIYLVPDKKDISFALTGKKTTFVIPKIKCHQIVVLEY
jgi:hypothetical protein